MPKNSITVIGGGSWATALLKVLSENHPKKEFHWWMRDVFSVEHIKKKRYNPRYLSTVKIPTTVFPTTNLSDAVQASEILLLVIPSAFLAEVLQTISPEELQNKKIIIAIKGVISAHNAIISDWLHEKYQIPKENIVAIGGPSHAEEVVAEKQSYLTFACVEDFWAKKCLELFENQYIKGVISNDISGIEYAAVMKNIMALGCGIAHGLGYGDNFQAVFVSNSAQEISVFLAKMIPKANRNIVDSAYLGDLLVTCYSLHSRNRGFGNRIGRGYSVSEVLQEMKMVAEGYYATKGIFELAKEKKINLPITEAIYQILYHRKSASEEIEKLKQGFI